MELNIDELKLVSDEMGSIHEASHAVMSVLVGSSVVGVWLEGRGSNYVGFCESTIATAPQDEVAIKFAGVCGELIETQQSCWSICFRDSGRSDWRSSQVSIDHIGGDRRKAIREAKATRLDRLTQHWPWVLAVAHKLRETRYLCGDEVLALRPISLT